MTVYEPTRRLRWIRKLQGFPDEEIFGRVVPWKVIAWVTGQIEIVGVID